MAAATSPVTVVANATCILRAIDSMSPEASPARAGPIGMRVPINPIIGPSFVSILLIPRSLSASISNSARSRLTSALLSRAAIIFLIYAITSTLSFFGSWVITLSSVSAVTSVRALRTCADDFLMVRYCAKKLPISNRARMNRMIRITMTGTRSPVLIQ